MRKGHRQQYETEIASISVLVMMLEKTDKFPFYLGKMEVSLFLQIMFRQKKNAGKLRQRMNLPRAFCVGKNLDRTIEELERMNSQMIPEWQESFWIKGELVLLLNEAYSAELCGFHIMYTQEEGLRYGKEEEHGEPGM